MARASVNRTRVLLVPTSDYVGHPFPQRLNHVFGRIQSSNGFEVDVVRFGISSGRNRATKEVLHPLRELHLDNLALYYLVNMPTHGFQIAALARRLDADVLVLSNLAPAVGAKLIVGESIPTILDVPDFLPSSAAGYVVTHNTMSLSVQTGLELMFRYLLRTCAATTVASKALGRYALNAGAKKVIYAPNGVDDRFFAPCDGRQVRERLAIREGEIVVGYIGSVEFWLDLRSLLVGIASAIKQGASIRLLLVGGGLKSRYSDLVRGWLKETRIDARTIWLDFVPYSDVPLYISAMDLCTIPFDCKNATAYYSGPNKLWEYLALSKPVISTPIPEVVEHENLVRFAANEADYARLILSYQKDPSSFLEKARVGQREARTRNWRNTAETMKRVILELSERR